MYNMRSVFLLAIKLGSKQNKPCIQDSSIKHYLLNWISHETHKYHVLVNEQGPLIQSEAPGVMYRQRDHGRG